MDSDGDSDDDEIMEHVAAVLARRRRAAAAALNRQKSGPKGKKRMPLSFFSWTDHVHRLSERDFKLRYRLDRASFNHLHGRIKSSIRTKNREQAKRSRSASGPVASEVRLAVTLRYLAGGMVDDLALIYHISKNEVYSSLWSTIDAINTHPDFDIKFPLDDADALREIEREFAEAHRRRYKSASWRSGRRPRRRGLLAKEPGQGRQEPAAVLRGAQGPLLPPLLGGLRRAAPLHVLRRLLRGWLARLAGVGWNKPGTEAAGGRFAAPLLPQRRQRFYLRQPHGRAHEQHGL